MFKRFVMVSSVVAFALGTTMLFAEAPAQPSQKMMERSQRKAMTAEQVTKMDEERIDQRIEIMTGDLGLSDDQQKKIKAILVKTNAAIRKILDEAQSSVNNFMKSDSDKIKALLTDAQRAKLDQLVAQAAMSQQMSQPPPAEKKK
jgi:Spy/CpxP family protein refolding chaperone